MYRLFTDAAHVKKPNIPVSKIETVRNENRIPSFARLRRHCRRMNDKDQRLLLHLASKMANRLSESRISVRPIVFPLGYSRSLFDEACITDASSDHTSIMAGLSLASRFGSSCESAYKARTSQTTKQIITRVPIKPYPNIVASTENSILGFSLTDIDLEGQRRIAGRHCIP